mmetsp:Transcript_61704/g.145887  ORF Transcript_61704/g.145887 Transcript_61704/m.145887 type:complete len:182 (-) Transcript_61704:38-583(-)
MAPVGSATWFVALAMGLGPTAICLFANRLLPECWPVSPIALFMWSETQAKAIASLAMTGRSRIILFTKDQSESELPGALVLHHGLLDARKPPKGRSVVHDSVLRVIGFTLLHGDEAVCSAARTLSHQDTRAITRYLVELGRWLKQEKRFVDLTGEPLVRCAFVETTEDKVITRVLLTPTPP